MMCARLYADALAYMRMRTHTTDKKKETKLFKIINLKFSIMKKITFLVAALCATMAVSAEVIEIANFNWIDDADTTSVQADQTVEKDGITLKFNGTILDATYNDATYRTLRVYAGNTLTVSCADKITKIEVIGMAKKGANITASAGTVEGGNYSSEKSDVYKYENGFDDPLFVVNDVNATSTVITPIKQIRLYGIRVTIDGGTAIRNIEVLNDVYAHEGRIYAEEGAQIYTIMGLNVTEQNQKSTLGEGIYIVKAGNKLAKIVVK